MENKYNTILGDLKKRWHIYMLLLGLGGGNDVAEYFMPKSGGNLEKFKTEVYEDDMHKITKREWENYNLLKKHLSDHNDRLTKIETKQDIYHSNN